MEKIITEEKEQLGIMLSWPRRVPTWKKQQSWWLCSANQPLQESGWWKTGMSERDEGVFELKSLSWSFSRFNSQTSKHKWRLHRVQKAWFQIENSGACLRSLITKVPDCSKGALSSLEAQGITSREESFKCTTRQGCYVQDSRLESKLNHIEILRCFV